MEQERVRAFADDIALVVHQLSLLHKIYNVFEVMHKVARLLVKPKKCVVVPLGSPPCGARIRQYKDQLHSLVPQWKDFGIKGAATYLGIWLGPEAGNLRWEEAKGTYLSRGQELACSSLPPSVTIPQYNLRAVTTLSYVGQVQPPTAALLKDEMMMVQRLHRFPHNTFPRGGMFWLREFGMKTPRSVAAMCGASAFRAAQRTCNTWRGDKTRLDHARAAHATLASLVSERHSMPWWDSPPIVDYWAEVSKGKFMHIKFDGKKVISTSRDGGHGLQGLATKIILQKLYPINWEAELARRIKRWLRDHDLSWMSQVNWATSLKTTRKLPPFVGKAVLSTWLNGWASSSRLGMGVTHACQFCGSASDRLAHLVNCPAPWKAAAKALGCRPPEMLMEKLALCNDINSTSKQACMLLATVCEIFHASRKRHTTGRFSDDDEMLHVQSNVNVALTVQELDAHAASAARRVRLSMYS